ncbi:hypothetical protein AVEN_248027-1 [Araneus ventricosus]|uniref:Uncharacterized protein n=1 Tax=Araneus ventricosus TaxID=182803 RepID=A0A4Y2JJY5_ARAVE|nr:hypothetical protein AVEN_248027-1 [Araneus ventricosus]
MVIKRALVRNPRHPNVSGSSGSKERLPKRFWKPCRQTQTLRNEIKYKNRISIGLDFVLASTGGMAPVFAHKTLEFQFRFPLLTANDAFFIIEVICVQIAVSVKGRKSK